MASLLVMEAAATGNQLAVGSGSQHQDSATVGANAAS